MNILIFNWRDIKNPSSGGAEILTHEIAKYWVSKGHQVTQFSSEFPFCQKEETLDGVNIIRAGCPDTRQLFRSIHWLAFYNYYKRFKGNIDIVIDEIHGLPFFTPWYVKEKKIALICEVADNLWIKMFGRFLGQLGRIIEKYYLKNLYSNVSFITISNSAKCDLIKNGVQEKNITVLHVGVSIPRKVRIYNKTKKPVLIFLGRLSPSKGVENALYVLEMVTKKYPKTELWILGRGEDEYIKQLHVLGKDLKIQDNIRFFGYVPEEEKFKLLSKAWILIHPSQTEGWGINVIEANAVGTPAVGYNISGLKDSIQDKKTGFLTKKNSPEMLSQEIIKLFDNSKIYKKVSQNALEWSKQFSWEKAGKESLQLLKKIYGQ